MRIKNSDAAIGVFGWGGGLQEIRTFRSEFGKEALFSGHRKRVNVKIRQ